MISEKAKRAMSGVGSISTIIKGYLYAETCTPPPTLTLLLSPHTCVSSQYKRACPAHAQGRLCRILPIGVAPNACWSTGTSCIPCPSLCEQQSQWLYVVGGGRGLDWEKRRLYTMHSDSPPGSLGEDKEIWINSIQGGSRNL